MDLMVNGKGLLISLIFTSLSFTLQVAVSSGEPESVVVQKSNNSDTASDDGEKQSSSVQERPPAMKVYIDPDTGEFLEESPDVAVEELLIEETEEVSTSPEGLEMVESDIPGEGVMIDLKGRFRSYQNAVKDSDGNISIDCDDDPHISLNKNEKRK